MSPLMELIVVLTTVGGIVGGALLSNHLYERRQRQWHVACIPRGSSVRVVVKRRRDYGSDGVEIACISLQGEDADERLIEATVLAKSRVEQMHRLERMSS